MTMRRNDLHQRESVITNRGPGSSKLRIEFARLLLSYHYCDALTCIMKSSEKTVTSGVFYKYIPHDPSRSEDNSLFYIPHLNAIKSWFCLNLTNHTTNTDHSVTRIDYLCTLHYVFITTKQIHRLVRLRNLQDHNIEACVMNRKLKRLKILN